MDKHILVVDDNQDTCWLIAAFLKEKGCKVDISYDGESALAKIYQYPYDLLILDYNLPGISGLGILKKSRQIRPSLQTVMISALGKTSIKIKAKELGASAFLDKPFDIDSLVRLVRGS
jgi:DNA-binding response OmpR family regulator